MGKANQGFSVRDALVSRTASGVIRYFGGKVSPRDLEDGPLALAIADYLDSNPRWLAVSEGYSWPRLKASVRHEVKRLKPIGVSR